jgi:hypothetical protein
MGLFGRLFGGNKRNARLAAWGKSIPLTSVQQEAMWELYQSMKAGIVPSYDPLENLNDEDKEYVFKVCSSAFRPAEYGNADTLRLTIFRDLQAKGFTSEQSAVLLGMMFNMVGRKDL